MLDPFVILPLAAIFIVLLVLSVRMVRAKNVKKLHDQVIDETTRDVLEACLAYGQSRLSADQYERFKDLLTDQISNGEGGLSLARLVEKCIAEAQEDPE